MGTIVVTPSMLRQTATDLKNDMEHALAITNQYLADHENIVAPGLWQGGGAAASHGTAAQIHHDLQNVITGATRLAEGLNKAAVLMEAHEADSEHAFHALFGGQSA